MENNIDEIIDFLLKNGSYVPYLKELREKSIKEIKKDKDLKEVLSDIATDVEAITKAFLNSKNVFGTNYITGISTGIYIPDYENNSIYKLKLLGGTTSRNGNKEVNEDTLFDVASITKLYTLVLCFKLEELGYLDLNIPIKEINPDFQNLEDFTLNDLIRLHGEIRTDGNVAEAESYEEALSRLKTAYLLSNDRTRNKYTDFGAMIIANTIEKIISKELNREMKYDDIMFEFLFKPLMINTSKFRPNIEIASGNANNLGLPHDPKSRNLGGVAGHAGIFTNSEGLIRLADGLFDKGYLNQSHLNRLGEKTFNNSAKGNLGIYLKCIDGSCKTFNPYEFSDGSFTHQGWTGSLASFDPNYKIHNNILVNAIEINADKEKLKNDKPLGFLDEFNKYQMELMKRIMLMYVVKKYYNKYSKVYETVNEVRKIR